MRTVLRRLFGTVGLKEIRERIADLKTLEQDILSVMKKLVGRLEALENCKTNKSGKAMEYQPRES